MAPEHLVAFGKRLRQAREYAGLSKSKFALKTGISKSMVTAYEEGDNDPRQSLVIKFCQILDVDISWLMGSEKSDYKYSSDFCRDIEIACKQLNDDGQHKVLEYALDLLSVERHKKSMSNSTIWQDNSIVSMCQ